MLRSSSIGTIDWIESNSFIDSFIFQHHLIVTIVVVVVVVVVVITVFRGYCIWAVCVCVYKMLFQSIS